MLTRSSHLPRSGSQAAARDERGGRSRRYPPLTQGAAPSLACCRVGRRGFEQLTRSAAGRLVVRCHRPRRPAPCTAWLYSAAARPLPQAAHGSAERRFCQRDPQGQVLQAWYDRRSEKDLVVKLNTGGGKTVAGLLICQSSLNEKEGPVLYLAPDPFLASQAIEQAVELGVEVTDDPRSARFTRGEVICVLSLHRFVNGKSVFGLQGDGHPVADVGTFLVDDAHAALATVREKFTLTLSRARHEKAFNELFDLFADDLRQQSEITYLGLTIQDSSAVAPVPFWAWTRRIADVGATLNKLRDDEDLQWSWPLIKDVLPICRAVFTGDKLEIQPPYPPINKIASFGRARRRVHLTATLADDSVLVTDFAADPNTVGAPITPTSAGYLGDRLILAPQDRRSPGRATPGWPRRVRPVLARRPRTQPGVRYCGSRGQHRRGPPPSRRAHGHGRPVEELP
ncbi:DEAD/DEAH box helicase [Streptomyces sp. NPDC056683]|uniref:DEAD/DEAH box helicase n=1 Tax=Streptomyces sp. NPDC056683 TaxID=3345910 RepID=UPI0036BC5723